MDRFDVCIVGAGVVGLAIAYRLANAPGGRERSIVILERESSFGQHTSSRNSEVIHAGIYYATGSLKADLCVRGKQMLYQHCEKFNVAHRRIGKFIVANSNERDQLEVIKLKAEENGVDDLGWVEGSKLKNIEPALSTDLALFSPSTGIIDSHGYMQNLLHLCQNQGVEFAPRTRATAAEKKSDVYLVHTAIGLPGQEEAYSFECGLLINSAGLYAQEFAASVAGFDVAALPKRNLCKGDYFSYNGRSPFKHLIYPLPEPNQLGLGVHATLDLSSQLRFGPDTNYVEQINYDIDAGKAEQFAAAIAKYFPAIDARDLSPSYSGIRPKLAAAGEPAADFVIDDGSDSGFEGLIQLFGFESPGLSASLAIAERVHEMAINIGR